MRKAQYTLRMRNRRLAQVIIFIFLCYTIFQFVFYIFIHKNDGTSLAKNDRNISRSNSYVNIQDFVSAAHTHGIPVIMLDPAVLAKVLTVSSSTSTCAFFCHQHFVTEFGVWSRLWNHKDTFLSELKDRGFSVSFTLEKDFDIREYLSVSEDKDVFTHYVLTRHSHSIHIVIMYERPSGYWWHGTLHHDTRNPFYSTNFSFNTESVYDKTEFIKVTMDGLKLRAPRYPAAFLDQIPQSRMIRCNHTRTSLFHKLHGSPQGDNSQIFRDAAKHVLSQAKQTLDYLGIKFWLSSGTCLGWYRQCDTIAYSGDVDIAIFIKDYDNRLIPAMQETGLMLKYLFGKETDSFELTFNNGHMKLDIFFFYEEADHMWNGGTQTKTGNKFKYIFPKFSLCWTEFLDMKLRVPCDPDTYLLANYGDWFKPVKNWDWKRSPPNVRDNGRWPEEEWDRVIVSFD